ncbi:hypothetical protein [Oricola sp.]|uniref:hypothetical protein n=1 Tax=Oricola sp. TaxID=1979950 RepID=UPI0025ED54E8|nr:hypothetical protein [Oricola sp.]MCI5078688.1 hypothetical protein [Oricola sp.]
MLKYILPKSLTWWTGVASIVTGAAQIAAPDAKAIGQVGEVLSLANGAGSAPTPATLIVLGLGLIGLRRKLEGQ